VEKVRKTFRFSCDVVLPEMTQQEAFDIFTAWWKAHRSQIVIHGIVTLINNPPPPAVENLPEEDLL
jgi:hypothetical protein